MSSTVSLLVVLPSVENVCLVAGQSDRLLHRNDLIALPIQARYIYILRKQNDQFFSLILFLMRNKMLSMPYENVDVFRIIKFYLCFLLI